MNFEISLKKEFFSGENKIKCDFLSLFLIAINLCFDCRDIFTALQHGNVCTALRDILVDHIRSSSSKIEVIVGLDARGFLFGFMLSAELGLPFVPIRKRGKLPGKVLSHEYSLEYGTDVFQIQENSIQKDQRVLIIDDLLATGGSMKAAYELVKSAGGIVEEIVVIMELSALNGRQNIPVEKIHSIIAYDD